MAGAVCVLIAAAGLSPLIFQQNVDNRLDQWVKPNSEEAARYRNFRERFGSDEIVIVQYSGKPLFTAASLAEQVELLERLESISEIEAIAGIPGVYRDIFGMEDQEELEKEFTTTNFYRNFLLSDDGVTAGLIMETTPSNHIDARRRLVRRIDAAIAPFRAGGWTTDVVGPPILNVSLDDISRRESVRLIPISLAVSCLVLLYFLRSWKAVGVGIASASITLGITVGTMAACDRPMNMVTTSMPALVWVLSLAGLVHLLHAHLNEDGEVVSARLTAAIAKVRRPCAISSVTTACGFFSLAAAPTKAVQDFGVFAGVGLLASFLVTFTLGTTLVRLLKIGSNTRTGATALDAFIGRVGHIAISRPAGTLIVCFVLALIAALPLPRLRTESNPLSYLPESSETALAYRTVPKQLTGLYTLELLIETPDSWLQPKTLLALQDLALQVEAMPEVAKVISPVAYLRKLNQWENEFDPAHDAIPASEDDARALIEEAEDSAYLARFAQTDERAVRLTALIQVMDSESFNNLVNRVRSLPSFNRLDGELTGIILQIANAQDALVTAQLRSLGLAFVLVFPCIFIGVRSFPLTLVSLIPNSFPVLAAFSLMALANIRIDTATVMVAGIAIGIAVDDTVHFLCAYQREFRENRDPSTALSQALAHVGPSITITTITSLAGFLVLLRSEFVPLQHFGLIAGSALIVALAADLFVLPATLTLLARRKPIFAKPIPRTSKHDPVHGAQ